MSNQKSGLRFRIPSWFAPASASSSQPPAQKPSDKSSSTHPPTTQTNNTSSAAAKQVPPPDEVQKTPFKPPVKHAQNSKSQSQKSKAKVDSLPEARRTSRPRPDKTSSPTKLNTQQPSTKDTKVQPAPTTPPHLPSASPNRSKTKKGSDHELISADEVVPKYSPPINSPKSTTHHSGGELKPTNKTVSQPSSPEKSPHSATKHRSRLNTTMSSQNSAINGEPVALNSSAQTNISGNEIPGQPKEQIPKSQGDSESPIPTPGSIPSNMNYRKGEIPESQLKPEVAKEVGEKSEEVKDKEEEKEKNVINEVEREESGSRKQIKEQQSVAVQPKEETKRNISESEANSPNQPRQKYSKDEFLQEHAAASKGGEFSQNKNGKSQVGRIIKTGGDEGRSVSVITVAGENRGASMEIRSGSSIRDEGLPIHRGYRVNVKDPTEEENNPKKIDDDEYAAETYINSNIQSINNSIMFNSSITERDPGVHVIRSVESKKRQRATDDKKKTVEARKAEFNTTMAKKLTYDEPPTKNIRRRCLRGLLLESSDSDDPEKPRPHGCRVACNLNHKVDIL